MSLFKGKFPSLHGRKVGVTEGDALAAKGGFVAGGPNIGNAATAGTAVLPGPQYWTLFDDFIHGRSFLDTGEGGGPWMKNVGTDTGTTADGAGLIANAKVGIRDGAQGGMAAIVTHHNDSYATAGDGATSAHSIVGQRIASTDKGMIHLAARIKIDDTGDDGHHMVFVGFTDDTGTAGEMAIYIDTGAAKSAASTGGDLAANATDAMGLLVGSANGDTGLGGAPNKWSLVSVGGGTVTTDPATADTGLHPQDWKVVEILYDTDSSDTGGTLYGAVDGNWFGQSVTNMPNKGVALAPVITLANNGPVAADTGSVRLDIDWISISGLRADTGS